MYKKIRIETIKANIERIRYEIDLNRERIAILEDKMREQKINIDVYKYEIELHEKLVYEFEKGLEELEKEDLCM